MKRNFSIAILILFCSFTASAQQKICSSCMNYIPGLKPNNILYHDTLYNGSGQFKYLFFRTRDPELMRLYGKHQSNKIAGNLLGIGGTVATIVGIGMIGGANKGAGWCVAGGGFLTTLTGGYLIFRGQQQLQAAVDLFNDRYNRTSFSIGVGGKQAGLVLNF